MKKLITALFLFLPFCFRGQDVATPLFNKIIFHTSFCMGKCPTYHLQIDNDKKVELYKEEIFKDNSYEIDSSKIGCYTGILNDSLYDVLINDLLIADINTLTFDDTSLCCDGSITTIIIYYNGKRKYLKSMFPPDKVDVLLMHLNNICNKNSFVRTSEKFKIEE